VERERGRNGSDVRHHPDPSILSWWATMFELPCVAIGGITLANAPALIEAGADFLAVSGAVWNGNEVETVQEFSRLLG
jgi:thiamine-phosphate pyrophosphorylase